MYYGFLLIKKCLTKVTLIEAIIPLTFIELEKAYITFSYMKRSPVVYLSFLKYLIVS